MFIFKVNPISAMKHTLFLIVLLAIITSGAAAQKISNVQVFQEDNKAVIMYDLLSMDSNKEFYVKLYCSTDEGKTFGPALTFLSGDANSIVNPGQGRKIIWDVLKESTTAAGNFVFRVDATSVGAKGVLPSVDDNKGTTLQFLDVARAGKDVSLVMALTNKSAASVQVILANFLIVDDHDKIYREFAGDVNKPISVASGEKKTIIATIKNVNPEAKAFSQLDFNASSVIVRLKNIPIVTEN
jgi:hypothetical protein